MARNEAAKRRQGLNTKNGKATRSAREFGAYGRTRPKADASVKRAKAKETDPRLMRAAAEQQAAEEKLAQLAETIERTGAHPLFLEEARASVALDKDETHVVGEPRQPGQRVSAEEVADFVARSTKESGVPLRVQDPAAIQKVATLLGVPLWVVRDDEAPEAATASPEQVTGELRKAARAIGAAIREAESLIRQGYHIQRAIDRTGAPAETLRRLVGNDGYAR